MNIAAALRDVAARQGGACAVIHGSDRITFGDMEARAAAMAVFLRRRGIGRGTRVMLMVKPSADFISLTFSLFSLGAVVILIDPGMGYRNLLRCIGAVRPEVLIGVPKALLFKKCFSGHFVSVRRTVCVGRAAGLLGPELPRRHRPGRRLDVTPTRPDDLAAIIFTTGSTGPPKGVRYEHRVFMAQLARIRDYYRIGPGETDQPGFPLFGLFSIALGARVVIPDMDPTRPAKVNPGRFIRTINRHRVTYSFGSPAIWNVVSRYCLDRGIVLGSLQKVLMAGAPVSGELIERVGRILPSGAEIHTPYGATEALPIVSMAGSEILADTWRRSREGGGICVGRALPGTEIRIIAPVDGTVGHIGEATVLPPGVIGEIIVKGEVVTAAYDHNEDETSRAKIGDDNGFWHRMGDMGYLDDCGRLWFCGRKAHRVLAKGGPMYSVCCEAVFNRHPQVRRSALVGVGRPGRQRPVLVVELRRRGRAPKNLFAQLRAIAVQYGHTKDITDFLVHPAFPVDIRHNAKIFREKLAVWAAERLGAARGGDAG